MRMTEYVNGCESDICESMRVGTRANKRMSMNISICINLDCID
jgi:hypothetical protein